ncbi:MAG: hypothetical protein V8S97_06265 [Oscillospiraceae bacterium]
MKRFFQKNGIMMLAAVVVVAVGLCIASAVSNQTGFLQNAAGVVTYPFRAAGSAVAGWFQTSASGSRRWNPCARRSRSCARKTPS